MFVLLTVCELENGVPNQAGAWFEKYDLFDQTGIENHPDPSGWAGKLIEKYNEIEYFRALQRPSYKPHPRHLVRCQQITEGEFLNRNFPVSR